MPGMATVNLEMEFGAVLAEARRRADLSQEAQPRERPHRHPGRRAGVGHRAPTDCELGVLAQACGVSVFDLLPPGYSLRVLEHGGIESTQEVRGREALDTLLREYFAMVVELRSGRIVTPPTLRHEDLVELAAAPGTRPNRSRRMAGRSPRPRRHRHAGGAPLTPAPKGSV